jgi:hypothetical protein
MPAANSIYVLLMLYWGGSGSGRGFIATQGILISGHLRAGAGCSRQEVPVMEWQRPYRVLLTEMRHKK